MRKKAYLCRPIIIEEPLYGTSTCVLIALFIGLEEWLVNRRKTGFVDATAHQ